MYTLENGRVVENLTYKGIENGWMVSPFFWWNGRKVREVYNAETEEIKYKRGRNSELPNLTTL